MVVIGILGMGEAGGELAAGFRAAGAQVRGYDVRPQRSEVGEPGAVVAGADVVLSVNSRAAAVDVARSVVAALGDGQVYADLNTAAPALKIELAALIAPTGASFADVAVMAPVPGRGTDIPVLAAGPGAARLAELLEPLGMPVEVVGSQPGEAAERKLLRSVFMKGLAATVIESLAAARAAGSEEWLRAEMGAVLDARLITRLEEGSRRHAVRRVDELEDAVALLDDLGVDARIARAAKAWLEELAAE